MADQNVVCALDDTGEGAEAGGDGEITVWEEGWVAAGHVVCWGDMESFLYVATVEVEFRLETERREACDSMISFVGHSRFSCRGSYPFRPRGRGRSRLCGRC